MAGFNVNHLDVSPRFAGVLMGLSNAFATIPGFVGPTVAGILAPWWVTVPHMSAARCRCFRPLLTASLNVPPPLPVPSISGLCDKPVLWGNETIGANSYWEVCSAAGVVASLARPLPLMQTRIACPLSPSGSRQVPRQHNDPSNVRILHLPSV